MKRKTIILGLLICIISISIFLIGNYDNRSYKENKKEESSFNTELAIILVDEEGVETNSEAFPDSSKYYLDFAKSYCLNGSVIGWNTTNNKLEITSKKADKCKVYFKEGTGAVNLKDDVLERNTLITTAPDFSVAATDTNANIYKAEDDLGDSYYFRGATINNYVKFGKWSDQNGIHPPGMDMYWRIIRINGDGTIRLIYDGISAVENDEAHDAYIGSADYTTLEYGDSSNVKKLNDSWYENNLSSTYGNYIAESIFCNDLEEMYSDVSGLEMDVYASYHRIYSNEPQLTCSKDKYNLTLKVGLITSDEVKMVSGNSFGGSYLATGLKYDVDNSDDNSAYWTISPRYGNEINGYNDDGETFAAAAGMSHTQYVRPVINLNADLLFTGSGSVSDPYVIAGFEE